MSDHSNCHLHGCDDNLWHPRFSAAKVTFSMELFGILWDIILDTARCTCTRKLIFKINKHAHTLAFLFDRYFFRELLQVAMEAFGLIGAGIFHIHVAILLHRNTEGNLNAF